jgi:hypothetical protein
MKIRLYLTTIAAKNIAFSFSTEWCFEGAIRAQVCFRHRITAISHNKVRSKREQVE